MNAGRFVQHFAQIVLLLTVGLLTGCGSNGPKTHNVVGRIQLQGSEISQLEGSKVEVALISDPTIRGFGDIQSDGSFQLYSLLAGELRTGVPEGQYTARILPNDEDATSRQRAMKAIAPRFLHFQRSGLTLDVPRERDVTFRLSVR